MAIRLLEEDDVRAMLREDMKIMCASTQQDWAARNNVSPQYVSDFMSGRKPPGPKILAALMLRRVVTYEPMSPEDRKP